MKENETMTLKEEENHTGKRLGRKRGVAGRSENFTNLTDIYFILRTFISDGKTARSSRISARISPDPPCRARSYVGVAKTQR